MGCNPFRISVFALPAVELPFDNLPAPFRGTLRAYDGLAFVSTLISHPLKIFEGASPKTHRPQFGVCEARRPSRQPRRSRPRTSRKACL